MQKYNPAVKAQAFLRRTILATIVLMISVLTFAQTETKKVDVDINTGKDGGNFFASPWVWVVGVAVFILLLVALMRGGSRKEA